MKTLHAEARLWKCMTSGTGFGNVKRWLIFFRKRESGVIVGGGAAPRGGVLDVEKPRHDRTSIPLLHGTRSPRRVTARVNVPDWIVRAAALEGWWWRCSACGDSAKTTRIYKRSRNQQLTLWGLSTITSSICTARVVPMIMVLSRNMTNQKSTGDHFGFRLLVAQRCLFQFF